MTTSVAKEVADQIINGGLFDNWPFFLLLFGLQLIAVLVASLIKKYAEKRGEAFATKADFTQLIGQLRQSTNLTEGIKAEIYRDDWVRKEANSLRKIKLEELLLGAYALKRWTESQVNSVLFDSSSPLEMDDPTGRVRIIGILYFPELSDAIDAFDGTLSAWQKWSTILRLKLAIQQKGAPERHKLQREALLSDENGNFQQNAVETLKRLEQHAQAVMAELLTYKPSLEPL